MRLLFVALAISCTAPAAAPRPPAAKSWTWREVAAAPSRGAADLVQHEEPAPGRTDGANGIEGFCPPRALVFDLGGGRALVTREPCSGATKISVRTGTGEQPIEQSQLYGVIGRWRVVPIDEHLVLMINEGTMLSLQAVDLDARTARFVPLPRELEVARSQGQHVTISSGELFLSGGTVGVSVPGPTGCEHPPPGMGCDPFSPMKQVPNHKAWAMRVREAP